MHEDKAEAIYLVDGSYYFHLKEIQEGFSYQVFDPETRQRLGAGVIEWADMLESPIRSSLACARTLAMEKYGAAGVTVQQVALRTLDQFPEARFAYRKEHGNHMDDHSIRFISSSYEEQFRIPDGGTVQIRYPDRVFIQKCEYLDDYHTRIGTNVFHICQFAEILEQNGGTVQPEPEVLGNHAVWEIGTKNYLSIQEGDSGWDYTLYDRNLCEIDGGQLDNPKLTIVEAREEILADLKLDHHTRVYADYDRIVEKAEQTADRSLLAELHAIKMGTSFPAADKKVKGGKER